MHKIIFKGNILLIQAFFYNNIFSITFIIEIIF